MNTFLTSLVTVVSRGGTSAFQVIGCTWYGRRASHFASVANDMFLCLYSCHVFGWFVVWNGENNKGNLPIILPHTLIFSPTSSLVSEKETARKSRFLSTHWAQLGLYWFLQRWARVNDQQKKIWCFEVEGWLRAREIGLSTKAVVQLKKAKRPVQLENNLQPSAQKYIPTLLYRHRKSNVSTEPWQCNTIVLNSCPLC